MDASRVHNNELSVEEEQFYWHLYLVLYFPRQSRRFDDASCSVVVVVVVGSVPTDAVLGRLRFHKKEPSEVEHQQRDDKYSLKA